MNAFDKGLVVVIVLLLSVLIIGSSDTDGAAPPTRATVLYSGNVDGVGSSKDICLAGHRDYNISFTFYDIDPTGVQQVGVKLKTGAISQQLFQWDLITPDIAQEMLVGQLDIHGTQYSYDGVNLTFFFKAFFHLNWDFDRQLTVVPSLVINSTSQDLDALSELQIQVHGTLEPYDVIVEKGVDDPISEGTQVKANSTLMVKNIKFRYWHLTEYLSPYSPRSSELNVVLNDGTSTWNATPGPDSFSAEIQVPDLEDAKVDLRMDLPGIHEDWRVKVTQWKFSFSIDGLSPDISLRYPAPTTKVDDEEFEWEITITERPKNKLDVDSSSVMYRVMNLGNWSEWRDANEVGDDRVIVVSGTAIGIEGQGNTSLQFRASDVLGNENISRVFPIDINQGPEAFVPTTVDGMEFFKNQSLVLIGTDWVIDPDDPPAKLRFEWYIDDDIQPYSTSVMFNKTLFTMSRGEHTVRMMVTDGDESDEASFSFIVNDVPVHHPKKTVWDILTDTTFLTIAIPILVAVLIVIVVIVIIIISKRMRKADDFVINEDSSMSASQAEEMARKIRELYDDVAAQYSATENDAQIDYDDGKFDFDYNLYDVLGLEKDSTQIEIKKKYRKLAAYYHPDRVATHKEIDPLDAAEHMVKINKAKEVLMNAEFKADYDIYISEMDFSMDLNEATEDETERADEEEVEEEDDETWD